MSNELQTLRLSRKIPARDIAEAVQELYPRFDRYLLSKCESDGAYGVQIKHDALKALYQRFAPDLWEKRQRRTDGHKDRSRIYCRMNEEIYTKLITKIKRDGFSTVQEWIMEQVTAYINGED